MFINIVWSFSICALHIFNSEVPFPEELFEDRLVARPWQAGVVRQSRVLGGVLLPSSWGQQRGVGASTSNWTVWWLVSNHKGHTVVGPSFQASASRWVRYGFDLLKGCWEQTLKWALRDFKDHFQIHSRNILCHWRQTADKPDVKECERRLLLSHCWLLHTGNSGEEEVLVVPDSLWVIFGFNESPSSRQGQSINGRWKSQANKKLNTLPIDGRCLRGRVM